jgi:hypothetical protein
LAAMAFLLWMLLESLFTWLAISALSLSPVPLFPRFAVNGSGEEWPAQRRLIAARDWLRSKGFVRAQALSAEIAGGYDLRVSVYHDAERIIRLQALFIPQPNGNVTVCYSLASQAADGRRIVTDNLHLPFGGFYPEGWEIDRRPWTRSLRSLVERHRRRVRRFGEIVPWEGEPLADINAEQIQLERVNTELGFLFPQAMREEYGKMTWEGRYRVWKELWLLNYFGRNARYR